MSGDSDSGRIEHRRTGDPSSSRHEETTSQRRLEQQTRLSRSQTEGPESSQREASEAHSRRWQDTARERRISPPDQTTQEWKIFSRNFLERRVAAASIPHTEEYNPYIVGYLSAYLKNPNQGRDYLLELKRERPQAMRHVLQAVILTDILGGGVSRQLGPEVRNSEMYKKAMNDLFDRWAHYRRMQNTAKELGISAPDQTTQEWKRLSRTLLERIKDESFDFHVGAYLSAYLENPNRGRDYRHEHHHELPLFAHAVMFTDILEGGVDPLLSQVRESNRYQEVMNTFFREWKKTLKKDEADKVLIKAEALKRWRGRMDSTEIQHSFGVFSTVMDENKADRTSADIDADNITPQELTDLINKKRDELRDKPLHPTPDKPTGLEVIRRGFTRHRVPKIMQSYEATNKIITNIESIHTLLDAPERVVGQGQLREIAALVSLVNQLYGKGYRNPAGTDQRTTAEIKTELVIYQKAADRLEQQAKSLDTGEELPDIDNALAQRLEQLRTRPKEVEPEATSPEERREHQIKSLDTAFEALNESFKRRGDYLTSNLEMKGTDGDDLVNTLRKLQSQAEEAREAAYSHNTELSAEGFRKSVRALRKFHDDYIQEISVSLKNRAHITVKERKKTIEQLQKREAEAWSDYKYGDGMLIEGYFTGRDIAKDLKALRDKVNTIKSNIRELRLAPDPEDATSYLEYERLVEGLEEGIMFYRQKVADGGKQL